MNARQLFGKRIRMLRKQQGVSIEELATRAEINDKYLGSVERAQQSPSLDIIEKIAQGLKVDIHELFIRRDQSAKDLRTRTAALLREADEDDLRRVVAVLEAMLH